MFRTIAQFEKVSYEQFFKDFVKTFNLQATRELEDGTIKTVDLDSFIRPFYDSIKLPQRATNGSAGYDFYTPIDLNIVPNTTVKIPTGIRCKMKRNYVLQIYPRSSLGFKYRCQLDNTVGIIDSDYYESDNEGHIFIKITNNTLDGKTIELEGHFLYLQFVFNNGSIKIENLNTSKEVTNGLIKDIIPNWNKIEIYGWLACSS